MQVPQEIGHHGCPPLAIILLDLRLLVYQTCWVVRTCERQIALHPVFAFSSVNYWHVHFSIIPHEQIWGQGHGERSQNECKDLKSLREVSMLVKGRLSLPKSNHLQLTWLEILKGPESRWNEVLVSSILPVDNVGTCTAWHPLTRSWLRRVSWRLVPSPGNFEFNPLC